MSVQEMKLDFFYLRKAFMQYGAGVLYVRNRYLTAPRIFDGKASLGRAADRTDLSVHVITRHRDLVMLAWSLASYYRASRETGQLFIHSDGSLTNDDWQVLRHAFPDATFIEPSDAVVAVEQRFGQGSAASRLRRNNPRLWTLQKLLDPYCVSDAPKRLVIDSDLMWFMEPRELDEAIRSSDSPPFMMRNNVACFVTYADGSQCTEEEARRNSGIVFYAASQLNRARLERYLEAVDLRDPAHWHFVEQVAYSVNLDNVRVLDDQAYTIARPLSDAVCVKHYTSVRRPQLYIEAMPKLMPIIMQS